MVTDHPEFQFLPPQILRLAVSGRTHDRAVLKAHGHRLQIVERTGRARLLK